MKGYTMLRRREYRTLSGDYDIKTQWVTFDKVADCWILTDEESAAWTFETHQEALKVLGTLADPYLVIAPILLCWDSVELRRVLRRIQEVFDINMSDLAILLGVNRDTIYAWLGGVEPCEAIFTRIRYLSSVADQAKKVNIPRLDKLLHRPGFCGRSLFDILKTDEDPLPYLATLKSIADREAQTRCEPKGSGKNLRSLDQAIDDATTVRNT